VYIPKLYNGKNKTFFFFSEEVFRNVTYANGSSFLTLPTAAMRQGRFQLHYALPWAEYRHRSARQPDF